MSLSDQVGIEEMRLDNIH